MIRFPHIALILAAGLLAAPVRAAAQVTEIPGFDTVLAEAQERLAGNRYKMVGAVELSQADMKFYADEVEYFGDTNRLVATGNVLVTQRDHQIAADRADFNAKTRLGTFYNARGFAVLGSGPDVSLHGTMVPDVQFYGDTIEKTSVDTYVISNGGFTTCAQANPRWEMTSGSLKLRVDHYALLRHMFLKVKGVPALYLPVMYYPINKDNRSTGFLMPSYGSSTVKGQTISNAFFWAINRSHDATILHDWYSKTGQAIAGEYRYMSLLGSGNLRSDFLNEHPTVFLNTDGTEQIQPGRRSFRFNGSLSQGLGAGWYAQGQANYASDLTVQQLYSTDINRASQRNRNFGGSVSGSLAGYRITGTYDRNEYFEPSGASSLRGNSPRISVARPDRTLGRVPVYASVTGEYVHFVSQSFGTTHELTRKGDIDRLDVVPTLRFPYTKLPYLSFNSRLQWRNTFWSDSLAPGNIRVDSPVARRFFEMGTDINGPTFVRIWDTPNSAYAQRIKHTMEPFLQIVHRTAIDNFDRIIREESFDGIVGSMTSYSYGGSTRVYAKGGGTDAIAREILSATIRQTFATDANAILSDQSYRTDSLEPPSKFSPIQMLVRTSPANGVDATFRTELDGRYSKFRTMGADGAWSSNQVSLQAGWSQVRFHPDTKGKNVAVRTHFLNSIATLRFKQNRFGVIHNFNYDVRTQSVLQQRIAGYYNAQCCGFTAEYQMFDLSRLGRFAPVQQDSRFHFSVTLAGIGNVSNVFGALGGTPNR